VDWAAVHGGLNPWKRAAKVAVDPFLVAKAVKGVMRQCPHLTATGKPLVWNEYVVFLELEDWERIKKLEATLVRDIGEVVRKELKKLKAEMVGALILRLLRDEGGSVRPGAAIVKADFNEVESQAAPDPNEMTIRIGAPAIRAVAEFTQRIPEPARGAAQAWDGEGGEQLRLDWDGGSATIRAGSRVVLGRPHPEPTPGFVALTGAGTKVNKRQLWIEAGGDAAVIGRLSEANPVEVKGRLIQAGGQISIDRFPAEISLSNGAFTLTLDRIAASLS
jgi:hypothetical protein